MVGDEEILPKSGVLTSPNYPERYPNSHDSTQTIQVAEGKAIRWTWTNFNTEPEYDYVQIVDRGSGGQLLHWCCFRYCLSRMRYGSRMSMLRLLERLLSPGDSFSPPFTPKRIHILLPAKLR